MRKILVLALWTLRVTIVLAQELKIIGMAICEDDLSAIDNPRNDFNKDLCGLIKVRLNRSGANFEGDIIEPVESTLKEYWVYMPEDSRYLTVFHQDYLSLEVSFDDYIKGGIKSGNTYAIEVQIPDMSIEQLSTEDLFSLGMDYYDGLNGKKSNLMQAEYLFHCAADRGNLDAQAMLGNVYVDRDNLNKRIESDYIDKKEIDKKLKEKWVLAEYWFSNAAEKKNTKAMIGMGRCELNKSEHVKYKYQVKHRSEAMKWFERAAKMNEKSAFYYIGYMYDNGFHTKNLFGNPDYTEAFKWYMKSAEAEDSKGMRLVAIFYDQGVGGMKKDHTQAFRWYKEAANHNDLYSQYKVAQFYENGDYIECTPILAFKYYDIAAKRGYIPAQTQLAKCYLNGFGVTADTTQAISLFRKAAEQENEEAHYWLGKCYDEGIGVEVNEKMALKWYLRATKAPPSKTNISYVSKACLAAGLKYMEGKIVRENPNTASDFFNSSAIRGNADGQYFFGMALMTGYGVKKNIELARKWLKKAAAQGHEDAKRSLKELDNKQ